MARIETDPNYSAPTFSRATAAADLFKKEDVQNLAAAMSTHDHSTGKGVAIPFGSIPNGTITSAMIADGTIQAGDIADGAVTSAKILDGTIATGDIAASAVTNAKLGADTARLNLLTNGGFEVWQRGVGPFTASGAYTADRWAIALVGGDTISAGANAANAEPGSQYAVAVTYTRSTGGSSLQQQGGNSADLTLAVRGRTVTFSARVKTTVASAVRLRINDFVSGAVSGSYHSGGGAYETLSVTAAVASSATNINISIVFEQSCTAYIDNAMLVVGSVPADYAPLHPADDLARCLRYYQKLGPNTHFAIAQAQSATSAYAPIVLPARLAGTPTLTVTGAAGNFFFWASSGTTLACTSAPTLAASAPSLDRFTIQAATSGLVAGNASLFVSDASGALSFEANP